MKVARRLVVGAAVVAFSAAALAQTVSLGGSLGSKALLLIDGKPRNVAVGTSVDGVRLVAVTGTDAVVEVQGKRVTLQLGGGQVNLGGKAGPETGGVIVLTAESSGHFFTSGTINGKTVRFVVDTGATTVAMGQDEADRIGLDYKSGQRSYVGTANGAVPAYRLALSSVRVGDVQLYNVDATILPAAMPYVLLGNSFLNRFQMRRDNDRMTLERRF